MLVCPALMGHKPPSAMTMVNPKVNGDEGRVLQQDGQFAAPSASSLSWILESWMEEGFLFQK